MRTANVLSGDLLYPLSIVIITIALLCIHFLLGTERFFKRTIYLRHAGKNAVRTQALGVFYKRLTAFLLYGICTLLIIKSLYRHSIVQYGFSRGQGELPFLFMGPVLLLTLLTMLFFSRRKKIYQRYPEVEGARTSRLYFTVSSLTYVLYLFGYECLFRGFLLFGLKKTFGDLPAALVSMGFVTLTHIGTSLPVIIGSMFSGIIFPYIALLSGSIWPVFLLHSCIGVGMDYLCAKYQAKAGLVPLAFSDKASS